ncbi:MAG: FAD-dependent monooxygenase [Alphaproteobacteria bacterium]|nr:FAD-dependent monooxygenase [Alphaproteobacteria bacterium]
MRETDIAIVGAGVSGALAAVMLGRAGHAVTLIDPADACRPDFRCEKLEAPHCDTLRRASVLDAVIPATRQYRDIWVARVGRLAEVKAIAEYGIEYSALVNRLRALVPPGVDFIQSKVAEMTLGNERQTLTLLDGETLSTRLVIGANGAIADTVGPRREISRCHSVSIGFDVDAEEFPFQALTYFGEEPAQRVAYLTVFPLPSGWRVNLFVYRALNDPWLRRLRDDAGVVIAETMPNLAQFTGVLRPKGAVRVRPVDLVATENVLRPGLALVGDAFSTACPVSGTGAAKALLDAERLCAVHVPNWLATPGMGVEKIAQYYNDAEKKRMDAHALRTSVFAKRAALGEGLLWTAFRWSYYAGAQARNLLERGELADAG